MAESDKWDQRYADASPGGKPLQVLRDNLGFLPDRGKALDLACGTGSNALFLAARGLQVSAWDFSRVIIEKLRAQSIGNGFKIDTQVRDLVDDPPQPSSFDVIVVGRFLERRIAPQISAALTPGGVLFYQTFSQLAALDRGPSNPAYRLAENELLNLFPDLQIAYYREGDAAASSELGESMLVAVKPVGQ